MAGSKQEKRKTRQGSVTGMQHYYTHSRTQVNTIEDARNIV